LNRVNLVWRINFDGDAGTQVDFVHVIGNACESFGRKPGADVERLRNATIQRIFILPGTFIRPRGEIETASILADRVTRPTAYPERRAKLISFMVDAVEDLFAWVMVSVLPENERGPENEVAMIEPFALVPKSAFAAPVIASAEVVPCPLENVRFEVDATVAKNAVEVALVVVDRTAFIPAVKVDDAFTIMPMVVVGVR
jgi:hypothetical protein